MQDWTDVRREVLKGQLSKRAACQKYGLSCHTLAKMLAHKAPPGYRRTQPRRRPKLPHLLPVIQQILDDDKRSPKKQCHTPWRIFERLRDEHGY